MDVVFILVPRQVQVIWTLTLDKFQILTLFYLSKQLNQNIRHKPPTFNVYFKIKCCEQKYSSREVESCCTRLEASCWLREVTISWASVSRAAHTCGGLQLPPLMLLGFVTSDRVWEVGRPIGWLINGSGVGDQCLSAFSCAIARSVNQWLLVMSWLHDSSSHDVLHMLLLVVIVF